jgi:hypothetical protein
MSIGFSRFFSAFFLLVSCTVLFAQAPERYVRAAILLEGPGDGFRGMSRLASLGIETDHGLHIPGKLLVTELSVSELLVVQEAGFETKIWSEDVKKEYLEKRNHPSAAERNGNCGQTTVGGYPTPSNYTYGSMGGYHTLEEMMAVLDDMRAKFPKLVSARAPISDSIQTWEGRPIWFVKISDNPDDDEPEPEVLYTALHHAREPNSASQMLFYMWYLLENYATDVQVRYIVDNVELYFIPCLNPDGYVFNQTTDPEGGGLWRKNRRENANGSFGVDINRNYGYFWGNDNSGSSPNPSSQTYRGPSAFSEPETRALRDFVLAHDFVFAHNYHTFSNLLIYPWAYNNELADPALAVFAALFTRENHYKAGTSIQTVGYNVNGSSDDWMFAVGGANSFTPEVGETFWPQPEEIDGLNRENLWQNLSTALCALRYGEAKDISPPNFSTLWPTVRVEFTRYGYENGPFTVKLSPLSGNVLAVTPNVHNISPQQFETLGLDFGISLSPSIAVGDEFVLLLETSNGSFSLTDTLRKQFGGKMLLSFQEDGNSLNEWTGNWGKTTSTFVSPPFSITDSPNGNYESNANNQFTLQNVAINIPAGAKRAQLRFWAKWAIEPRFDYVQVRGFNAVLDQPLCGRYTQAGISPQPVGEPIFDGEQSDWVEETLDISDFIGQSFRAKFILRSDNGLELDGFYFDDLRVEYLDPTLLQTVSIPLRPWALGQNEPNPSDGFTVVRWEETEGQGILTVANILGQKMAEIPLDLATQSQVQINTQNWPTGTYTYWVQFEDGQRSPARKMTVRQ